MDIMHVQIMNIPYLLGVVTVIEVMIFQEILQKKTRSYGHMMQLTQTTDVWCVLVTLYWSNSDILNNQLVDNLYPHTILELGGWWCSNSKRMVIAFVQGSSCLCEIVTGLQIHRCNPITEGNRKDRVFTHLSVDKIFKKWSYS